MKARPKPNVVFLYHLGDPSYPAWPVQELTDSADTLVFGSNL